MAMTMLMRVVMFMGRVMVREMMKAMAGVVSIVTKLMPFKI